MKGVDERVAEHLADEELAIGDYVLSGGELAAAVVIDVIARLIPGVLGNADSAVFESFEGMRECWIVRSTRRPAEFRGWRVPEVLLSGNHEQIRRWRQRGGARRRRAAARSAPESGRGVRSAPDFKYDRKN